MRLHVLRVVLCAAVLAGIPVGRADVVRVPARETHEELNDLAYRRDWGGSSGQKEPLLEVKVLEALDVRRGVKANLTLLRRAGRLSWPSELAGDELAKDRRRLTGELAALLETARKGKDVAAPLKGAVGICDDLVNRLDLRVDDLSPNEYIRARVFLGSLRAAAQAAATPAGVADLKLLDELASERRTPSDLARFLLRHKLKFARPASGDEEAYEAVKRAFCK